MEQRAAEGPTADQMYPARFDGDYGRQPTLDETAAFRSQLEDRVSAHLTRHSDLGTSARAS